MAKKTFISYKYSEARHTRDKIIKSLGEDARYYNGETVNSPKLRTDKAESIKRNLKEMIYGTSVIIVIVSPSMKRSEWIDWEISYALKEYKRQGRKSSSNGVLAVIQEQNGDYSWFVDNVHKPDGCVLKIYNEDYVCDIINKNRFNRKNLHYSCSVCQSYDSLNDSYISYVKEEDFLNNPNKYIDNAHEKSQRLDEFCITKQVPRFNDEDFGRYPL